MAELNYLCPEYSCPRRKDCKSAKPHEHQPWCDDGCWLHGEARPRKKCVPSRVKSEQAI